ncbi:hypothetical protein [Janthinobacterium lividum]|uniref:hypothetical protein n=1 Tax=Janthinobacterium lividum TaxID=29581 RepID=UPI000873CDB7|nr:hypothetical protein [Janthinobacterium lividum]MCC7712946.1 hypothetical protein [Janthinobacterium lividum]OEZ55719.1 hypothetical protein JANLI_31130 [Janthinobacterium lividum]WQE31384.1 hypothetical protein U0004_13530 [Janthinobacterium lividum]STQ96913.1 Uncharacterised protein [Janthinobacterium lividum]
MNRKHKHSNDFGARTTYSQADLVEGVFSTVAISDGFVMASIGQPTITAAYLGMLEGSTIDAGGSVTSHTYATGCTQAVTASSGKKGAHTYFIPMPGNFTMTVRAGETWKIQLTAEPAIGPAPLVEFVWTPENASSIALETRPSPTAAAMAQLREEVASGRLQENLLASAQRTIDERVGDFAHVFGDATKMSNDEGDRTRFVQGLQKIVCSARPAGQPIDNRVDDADLVGLVAAFGQATGRNFGVQQQDLLKEGIRALVKINENAANRGDLGLIDANVRLFLDNVQRATDISLGNSDRRLLTRALVRLVGDGRHG